MVKSTIAFGLALFLLVAMVVPVLAVDYNPGVTVGQFAEYRTNEPEEANAQEVVGVKVGDWAKYSVAYTWQSTNPAETEPEYIQEVKKIEYLRLEIQGISGTNITFLMSYHLINGTDITFPTSSADIARRGADNFLVIPGNLNKGDLIPGPQSPINDTITRRYAGIDRTVNFLGGSGSSPAENWSFAYYWDRASGILCEMMFTETQLSVLTDSYAITTSSSIKLIETNILVTTEPPFYLQPWFLIIIIVVAVIVLVALILKTKKTSSIDQK